MEVLIVVVIISIIVAFAIPQYNMAVRKRQEQDAVVQLMGLYAANKTYQAKYGRVLSGTSLTVTAINDGLGINIVPNDKTYSYSNGAGTSAFTATAQYNKGSPQFSVGINENSLDQTGGNPYCASAAGTCPTL